MAVANAPDPDDFSCVFRAVRDGVSDVKLRRLIDACARGCPERRAAAASAACAAPSFGYLYASDAPSVPAIQVAYELGRGDVIAVLLESGADVSTMFGGLGSEPVALCLAYDLPLTLEALLRSGRIDPNAPTRAYSPPDDGGLEDREAVGPGIFSTAVHLCVRPMWGYVAPLACLRVLGRHGVNVNALDSYGDPPIVVLAWSDAENKAAAAELLIELGADVNATGRFGTPAISWGALYDRVEFARVLLSHGALVNGVANDGGGTPLMAACDGCTLQVDVLREVLRRSSPETRRRVDDRGASALDFLLDPACEFDPDGGPNPGGNWSPDPEFPLHTTPAHREIAAELMASGASVLPRTMKRVAARGAWLDRQLELSGLSPLGPWPVYEAMVGLASDMREAREDGARIAAKERRVRELEAELRRRGEEGDGKGGGDGDEGEDKESEGKGG